MQRSSDRLKQEYFPLASLFLPRIMILDEDSKCLSDASNDNYTAEWAIYLDMKPTSALYTEIWNRRASRKQSVVNIFDDSLITNNLLVEIRNHPRIASVGSVKIKSISISLMTESQDYDSDRWPHRINIEGYGFHSSVEFEASDFKTHIISTPIMDDLIGILLERL